jgi:IclR family KDG regulon transcriptional repressor
MKKAKSEYSIQTVSNALRLLETFRGEQELGVTELSLQLGLHKNNVFRLLATLEQRGYIEQCPKSERYRLGVSCVELGNAYNRGCSLVDLARPRMAELAESLNETVHLAVLSQFEVIHLLCEQPDQLLHSGSRVGQRLPAYCTSLGKVLLACGDPALREDYDKDYVAKGGLKSRTSSTIVDRDKFFEHLRGIAAEGLAIDGEECEEGLACVAVPVYDASGRAVAALSASGPAFRFADESLRGSIAPAMTQAAKTLSTQLGFTQ